MELRLSRRKPSRRQPRPSAAPVVAPTADGEFRSSFALLLRGEVSAVCGLLLLAFVAYANCYAGVFVLDDISAILGNRAVTSPEMPSLLRPAIHRPLTEWTYWMNYQLHGSSSAGFHFVNVLIHAASGVLLFDLIRLLIKAGRLPEFWSDHARGIAFATTAIWLCHPLQTNAVTYVVQRAESLMALSYLLFLWTIVRGNRSSRSAGWYIAALVACWAGMATKQVMVTAPVVAVALDRTLLAGSWQSLVRQRGWLYILCLPAMVYVSYDAWKPLVFPASVTSQEAPIMSVATTRPDDVQTAGFEFRAVTPMEYLRTQPQIVLHYLALVLWPHPLCLDYDWPIAESWSEIVLSGLVIGAILTAGCGYWFFRPAIGLLIWLPFVILAPTSSVLPIRDLAFEHRMYLPLAPIAVLVVIGSVAGIRRFVRTTQWSQAQRDRGVWGLLAVVLLPLVVMTWLRNTDYHSLTRIYEQTASVSPHGVRVHVNLGRAYLQERQPEKALAAFDRAMFLDAERERAALSRKELAIVMNNQGTALQTLRRFDDAADCYRQALEIDPKYVPALHNLANTLSLNDQLEAANEHYANAHLLAPKNHEILYDWANLASRRGQFADARDRYLMVLEAAPENVEARINLAAALIQLEDFAAAAREYVRALKRLPAGSDEAAAIHRWLQIYELSQRMPPG